MKGLLTAMILISFGALLGGAAMGTRDAARKVSLGEPVFKAVSVKDQSRLRSIECPAGKRDVVGPDGDVVGCEGRS